MSTLRQNRPDLADLVARSRDLYSLPAVVMKMLQLTECSKVNAQALKECIEMDPANLSSAAERCLFAARSAGGNSVKSIEL